MAPTTATSSSQSWLRRITIGAVILVPLAFAGAFVGAISGSNEATDRIPAALVNEDQLIYQSAEDGTETPVFAGRQLVTELTADNSFNWQITNSDDADRSLAAGEVYAILTIPKDFSDSILSLSGDDPRRAAIDIRTDDAHSYLTGALSETVGTSMANTFGKAITTQYITGIYAGIGELGSSLGVAADGAGQLSSGVDDLSGGLSTLSSGAESVRSGAASLSGGITTYTGGVDSLSRGLSSLRQGAAGLSGISSGVGAYTGQVSQLAAALAAASADLNAEMAADPTSAAAQAAAATVGAISAQLNSAAAGGAQLAQKTGGGIAQVQGGISQSASGAAKLAAGSASLRSGASSLASGLGGLSSGASSAASGADSLASGASELATGLQEGARQVPAIDTDAQAAAAEMAADPVGLTVTRDNEISGAGQAVAAFIVPLGLWIGALAVFLIMRPLPLRMLSSTARTGRLLWSVLARASMVTLAQALLLVGLLHLGVGVSWTLLPATLGFAVLTALAFTAFHHLLIAGLGRAGLVVSLLAIAIQVTSSGGLYPIQLLAAPYQVVSPLLPLTYAVGGMQGILAGGAAAPVLGAVFALLAFGLVSVFLSVFAIRRVRRASMLGLLSTT